MSVMIFVVLYLLVSIVIGIYAAVKVRNTSDYANAGRSLPLIMVVTTTFATWFGSEAVLGIPSKAVEGGLSSTVEDPFGSSMCLVLVGMFFAARLYKLNLLTIGDYYRHRYGRGVEMFTSVVIMISYLGWVAAQVTALGIVFSLLSHGAISVTWGMAIGIGAVLIHIVFGGMWSVAITDFLQMAVVIVGLALIAWFAADLAGGAGQVVALAQQREMFRFFPDGGDWHGWIFWISAAITMMFGSIPQQDVYQRVMAAKDAKTARRGPVIGGVMYLLFAFVPMFIGTAAFVVMPDTAAALLQEDSQKILPTLVMEHMPVWLQIMFFGALLSAIMSCASATLLAPSTTFVENILKNFVKLNDRQQLRAMKISLSLFTLVVLAYSIATEGTPIYDQVAAAYQFPLVGAFWPLLCGLYWKRATTQGAVWSIVLGVGTWALIKLAGAGEVVPEALTGFVMAGIGMVAGSLLPTRGNRSYRQPVADRAHAHPLMEPHADGSR